VSFVRELEQAIRKLVNMKSVTVEIVDRYPDEPAVPAQERRWGARGEVMRRRGHGIGFVHATSGSEAAAVPSGEH
jgi:hypothetical protein